MAKYFPGAEGRMYLYESYALYRCPYQDELYALNREPADPPTETPKTDTVQAALDVAGLTLDARRMLLRAHRSTGSHPEGMPADECAACGATKTKIGYRTWKQAPIEQIAKLTEGTAHETTVRLNARLGNSHARVPDSDRFWPTKKEAIAWAREEAQIDKQAVREEVRS